MNLKSTGIIAPALLLAACAVLLLQTTDLTIVDLGRHIKNGEMIVHGSWAEKQAVLHTNFYSYTNPQFPFVNHHWLSGTVFYLWWRMFGFGGLTILYAILVSLAVLLVYVAAKRGSTALIAAPVAALALPVIVWRADVRPECFTYLFTAGFYFVLAGWNQGFLSIRWLYSLPFVMLLWVNLHIGFVFGFLLIGLFLLKTVVAHRQIRTIAWVAALATVAAMLNPSFLQGLLYPLNIFRNYGYDVAENQSIMSQSERGLGGAFEYQLFGYLLALAAASFVVRWLRKKPGSVSRWPEALLLGSVGVLAVFAVRNLPLFCLLMVPICSENLHDVAAERKAWLQATWLRWVAAAVFVIGLLCAEPQFEYKRIAWGIGLRAGVDAPVNFLKQHGVAGPIFNDIDVGGYLIFNFVQPGAGQAVFVDGRPEAYPESFLKDSYIAALSDDTVWHRLDEQYHFNVIVCSLQDAFKPVERFLLARAWDPEWAPVYTDTYSLIFVRRNDRNAAVIRMGEIPKDRFRRP